MFPFAIHQTTGICLGRRWYRDRCSSLTGKLDFFCLDKGEGHRGFVSPSNSDKPLSPKKHKRNQNYLWEGKHFYDVDVNEGSGKTNKHKTMTSPLKKGEGVRTHRHPPSTLLVGWPNCLCTCPSVYEWQIFIFGRTLCIIKTLTDNWIVMIDTLQSNLSIKATQRKQIKWPL